MKQLCVLIALLCASVFAHGATCDKWAVGSTSTSGLTQIVAANPNVPIYVCSFFVNSASATVVNAQLQYGTGTNCGTGTTPFSLVVPMSASGSTPTGQNIAPPPNVYWGTPNGNSLCINLSAAQTVNWQIHYTVAAF